MSVSVAIQGAVGAYHEQAARQYFGADVQPKYCGIFADVFAELEQGKVDYGLVAVENSLHGSIGQVSDLLRVHSDNLCIVGELYLGIHHCLLGLPGAAMADIRTVYSQDVALSQCEAFLRQHLPSAKAVAESDTALSAKLVHDQNDPTQAAIASATAGQAYGLEVLRRQIEDDPQNYTRFVVLKRARPADASKGADKTSLVFSHLSRDTDDSHAGELYHTLAAFAQNNVSLSKIESRPVKGQAWRYYFYLDCAAGLHDPAMQATFHDLAKTGAEWTVLGSYIRGKTY